jgi:MFS family permease
VLGQPRVTTRPWRVGNVRAGAAPYGHGPPSVRPAEEQRFYGWRIVRALAFAQTISWGILYYAFAALLVPMQRDLGFSTSGLTGAFALAVAVTGVAAVPVGRWVDRHGARALMTCGSAGAAALVLAWSRVHTVLGLYATFAGIGIVSACVLYEPAFAVIVRWFHDKRDRALLAITTVAGFASTVFLPLTAYLAHTFGWRHALWVLAAVLAFGTVLPYALVLRRDPSDLGLNPDGAGRPAEPVPATPSRSGRERATLVDSLRWARRNRRFWLLTTAYTAHTTAVAAVSMHLIPLLLEHGHSTRFAALDAGSLGLLSVTGRITATGAFRRWPVHRVAGVMSVVQALGALVLLLTGATTLGAIAFGLMFGIGFGVGTITRPALAADAFGTAEFATLSALMGIALTAAKATGPVTAGLLRTWLHTYDPVLLMVIMTCTVASVAVWLSGPVRPGALSTTEERHPVR